MEIIEQKDAATLLPIISDHIHPGTTVWSDMWAAYNGVGVLPGVLRHDTINHSIQFINPVMGIIIFTQIIILNLIGTGALNTAKCVYIV